MPQEDARERHTREVNIAHIVDRIAESLPAGFNYHEELFRKIEVFSRTKAGRRFLLSEDAVLTLTNVVLTWCDTGYAPLFKKNPKLGQLLSEYTNSIRRQSGRQGLDAASMLAQKVFHILEEDATLPQHSKGNIRAYLRFQTNKDILEHKIREYINTSRHRYTEGMTAYLIAWAFDWLASFDYPDNDPHAFARFLGHPDWSIAQLLDQHERFAQEQRDAVEGSVYKTKDGEWQVKQFYYKPAFYSVGDKHQNCLLSIKEGAGRRYLRWSRVNEKGDRPFMELFTVSQVEKPNEPTIVFSYIPSRHLVADLEMLTANQSEPFRISQTHPAYSALFESLHAMSEMRMPGSDGRERRLYPINAVAYCDLICDENELLTITGVRVPLSEKSTYPMHEYIAGGVYKVSANDSLRDLARLAQHYPLTLMMTHATQEQKDALVHVRGSVIDASQRVVRYSNLLDVGCAFDAGYARVAYLPHLESVGTACLLKGAERIAAPKLRWFLLSQISRFADIRDAKIFHDSALHTQEV